MKTIKLQEDEYVTLATGTELREVPEYATIDKLRRRDGSSSWYWRKRLPSDPNKRFTGTEDKAESHRLINRDYHLLVQGEKLKARRVTSPTLAEIATCYANAKISYIDAIASTRHGNLLALKKVTRHLGKGEDPRFRKVDGQTVELVSAGFWNNVRLSDLNEKAAKDFLADCVAGLSPESKEYQNRATGANDYLRQARGVFRKEAIKLYKQTMKVPNIKRFMKSNLLKVQKVHWQAPPNEFLAKFYRDLPQLKKDDPDAFAMFVLCYGAGLSRSESLNAKYSWMRPEEVTDIDMTVSTHWFIHVQPDGEYRPKNQNRIRKAEISESLFQKLLDLRYVFREERADRLKKIILSDEELAKAVWSKAVIQVADDLGVSDACVSKTCQRRGIPRPGNGFWTKVKAGLEEHPNGQMPDDLAEQFRQRDRVPTRVRNDDYIIQRGRNTGKSGAPARLAKWFRDRGWDRKQVTHELRKIHVSLYLLETGDMYAASKQAGHGSYRTTERFYTGIIRRHKVNIELPTG